MSSNNQKVNGKEMVISFTGAPRLERMGTQHFIEFKLLHNLYENQIEEKWRQLKEETVPISYKAFIEDGNLEICKAAQRIEASSIDEIPEQ